MLYVVATPIGNLEDITMRALETLKSVDLILAEDTRHTKILLNHYSITTQITSMHGHTQAAKLDQLVGELAEGKTMAMVADAGTPGICDPGYQLIKRAVEAKIKVVPIPGPAALTTVLSVSGLPMHNFLFLGFLPLKKGRQTLLKSLVDIDYTVVFYESVHRIEKTLKQLVEFGMGEREMCLGREMTKQFETFYRGTVSDILLGKDEKLQLKGEFACVMAPSNF